MAESYLDNPALMLRMDSPPQIYQEEVALLLDGCTVSERKQEFERTVKVLIAAAQKEDVPIPTQSFLKDLHHACGLGSLQWADVVTIREATTGLVGALVPVTHMNKRFGASRVREAVKSGSLPTLLLRRGLGIARCCSRSRAESLFGKKAGQPPIVKAREVPSPVVVEEAVVPAQSLSGDGPRIVIKNLTLRGGSLSIPRGVQLEIESLVVEGTHSLLFQ